MSLESLAETLQSHRRQLDATTVYRWGVVRDLSPLTVELDAGRGRIVGLSSVVEVAVDDRVAVLRQGTDSIIMGRSGGITGSPSIWELGQQDENNADLLFEQSELIRDHKAVQDEIAASVREHGEHLADVVDPFIASTDTALAEIPVVKQSALDALVAAGNADDAARRRWFFGAQPPPSEEWVEGQIWAQTADYPHYETGETKTATIGLYKIQNWEDPNSAWDTYTLMSGMIIVAGVDEDGNPRPTVIDQSGMVVGHVTADSITGDVIAARSLRGEHLVIASVTPDLLDGATQDTLAGADAVRRRVVIQDTGIVISESAVGPDGVERLSGLDLQAKRMAFVLGGEPRAYIDSEKNMMGMEHLVVERSAQFGEHQVMSLGGSSGQTIFRWTGSGG